MKRILLLTFILLLCIPVAALAEFWASKNKKTDIYHYSLCRETQKIKPSKLVKFNTAKEAIKAGYEPCKLCRPPSK
jgi:methylphosphotriester-DNA--protein-cysteine methyltransferase